MYVDVRDDEELLCVQTKPRSSCGEAARGRAVVRSVSLARERVRIRLGSPHDDDAIVVNGTAMDVLYSRKRYTAKKDWELMSGGCVCLRYQINIIIRDHGWFTVPSCLSKSARDAVS